MSDTTLPASAPRRSRRQFLVLPRYQMQFALLLVVFQFNVGLVYQGVLQMRVVEIAEQSGNLAVFLNTNLWNAILPWMLAASAGVAAFVYIAGLLFSNSIVGPIPRLRAALGRMAAGDYSARLEFRPGDALEDLARDVNQLAETLQRGVENERSPLVPATDSAPSQAVSV
jgi:methyl-accepting chemotaxis protein